MQVQHLIEECIIFNMNQEECMDALSKHANIQPIITSTGNYSPICHSFLPLLFGWVGGGGGWGKRSQMCRY